MILLAVYISVLMTLNFSVLTGYLYWKEDERYKYTAAAAAVFGAIAIGGMTWFMTAFS